MLTISPLKRKVRLRSNAKKAPQAPLEQCAPLFTLPWKSLAHRYSHTVDYQSAIAPMVQSMAYWFSGLYAPESIVAGTPVDLMEALFYRLDVAWRLRRSVMFKHNLNPIESDAERRTRRIFLSAMVILDRIDALQNYHHWVQIDGQTIEWDMLVPWSHFLSTYRAVWFVRRRETIGKSRHPIQRRMDRFFATNPLVRAHWKTEWQLWSYYRASTNPTVRQLQHMVLKAQTSTRQAYWGQRIAQTLTTNGKREFIRFMDAAMHAGWATLAESERTNPWLWLDSGVYLRWDRFVAKIKDWEETHITDYPSIPTRRWLHDIVVSNLIDRHRQGPFFTLIDRKFRLGEKVKALRMRDTRYWLGRFWFYAQNRQEKTRFRPTHDIVALEYEKKADDVLGKAARRRSRIRLRLPQDLPKTTVTRLEQFILTLQPHQEEKLCCSRGFCLPQSFLPFCERDPLLVNLLAHNLLYISDEGECLFPLSESMRDAAWRSDSLVMIIKPKFCLYEVRNDEGHWTRAPLATARQKSWTQAHEIALDHKR